MGDRSARPGCCRGPGSDLSRRTKLWPPATSRLKTGRTRSVATEVTTAVVPSARTASPGFRSRAIDQPRPATQNRWIGVARIVSVPISTRNVDVGWLWNTARIGWKSIAPRCRVLRKHLITDLQVLDRPGAGPRQDRGARREAAMVDRRLHRGDPDHRRWHGCGDRHRHALAHVRLGCFNRTLIGIAKLAGPPNRPGLRPLA